MEIRGRVVTVRELAEGYINSDVEGVRGFGGQLDIRPQCPLNCARLTKPTTARQCRRMGLI